ncbi:hypothetical protein MMC22_004852 [Lobaria immixta]|nr:hypothetical protein [Lobaria immixta]
MDLDPIDCRGELPQYIPFDYPRFPTLQQMCASKEQHLRNLECLCEGEELLCGSTTRADVRSLIHWCQENCLCGFQTTIATDRFTTALNYGADTVIVPNEGPFNSVAVVVSPFIGGGPGHRPAGSDSVRTRTCTKTCSNINRDCDQFFTGDCKCYAPPVTSLFWHSGGCGLVHHLPKRDLAQHRRSYYLNATAQFAPPNKNPAPSGPHPDIAAQLASGLLPSPCNDSYVSFACSDSKDGIVHEPPQNWLGALLPENAKESNTLPPVPEEWLRIHGREGKLQVEMG